MPQMDIFNPDLVGSRFEASYWSEPLNPDAPGHFSIVIKNGQGTVVDSLYTRVPLDVTHEMPAALMRPCYEAWLFGDRASLKRIFNATATAWKLESQDRRHRAEGRGVGGA